MPAKQPTPTDDQISAAVSAAHNAVTRSRETRARYRRRRTPQRNSALQLCRTELTEAAAPIRSYIGMVLPHDLPRETELTLRNASADLRFEREQIRKML